MMQQKEDEQQLNGFVLPILFENVLSISREVMIQRASRTYICHPVEALEMTWVSNCGHLQKYPKRHIYHPGRPLQNEPKFRICGFD